MGRQLVFGVVFAGCLGAGLFASERATFILTDGERISGVVVFHTEGRTNIRADKQEFNVGVTDGREVPIPFDHVAVIDFVGGKPKSAELAALTDDSTHTIVLRDGTTRHGRLVDLIGGDTVRWRETDGGTQDLPIRDVRRVYLNNTSARAAFDVPPATGRDITPATSLGTGSTGRTQPDSREVAVRADTPWNDTGLTVRKGDRLSFAATGRIGFGRGTTQTAGPGGNDELRRPSYPVRNMPVGSLIGKIGNGAPFMIGANSQAIVMPDSGRLMLAVNDDDYTDNEGAFHVMVARVR
jgi:hypothetical protein